MKPIQIASVEAFSFRVPVQMPIKVAFGTFRDRPLVLVRVTDGDGAEGWREVWANWPAVGAEHRAGLAVDIGERLIGKTFESPQDLVHKLTASLQVLAGGEGLLEFDCHPNMGPEAVVGELLPVRDGRVPVPQGAGLGAAADLDMLARYRTSAGA